MSRELHAFTCSACGEPLNHNIPSKPPECASGSSTCEANQSKRPPTPEDPISLIHYCCPSCGAEMVADAQTAPDCCPYCGTPAGSCERFSGSFEPDYIIPFKIDREQALAALKRHYKGKWLLPHSFTEGNHLEQVQGVYVPFWLFDCQSSGTIQLEASSRVRCLQGNEEITITKYFDVFRTGTLEFEKIPADASSRMPDSQMNRIEPYDYSDLQPFTRTCMPGFLAESYDVEASVCMHQIRSRCEQILEEELQNTVTGYDSIRVTGKSLQTAAARPAYALMPVWLLDTQWKGEHFLFVMNGQTGRLVGDLPMDREKYWKYFFVILAVLEAVMGAITCWMQNPGPVVLSLLFALPLLIDWVILSSMKGQLKPNPQSPAAGAVSGRDLQLQEREDRYVWTSEQRTTVQTVHQKV